MLPARSAINRAMRRLLDHDDLLALRGPTGKEFNNLLVEDAQVPTLALKGD
jgi:precorrin-6x reductase